MSNKRYVKLFITSFLLILVIGITASIITENISSANTYNTVSKIIAQNIAFKDKIVNSLKSTSSSDVDIGNEVLSQYGFTPKSFKHDNTYIPLALALAVLFLQTLIIVVLLTKSTRNRIKELAYSLHRINSNRDSIILATNEDDFSILEDELSKTVIELKSTKEHALKSRQSLAENLANISHQIKTPITSIGLMSELLQNNYDDKLKKKYLFNIDTNVLRIEKLVSSLLKLSRLDADVIEYHKEDIDIYSLLLSSIEVVHQMAIKKRQKMEIQHTEDLKIYGDFYWCSEAVINILKNCIEHTPSNGIIKISYSKNPIYKQIVIEDNGKGLSEKDISHIFDRFYKGENSSKNSIGIGLTLAKAIIEKHNGEIFAENIDNSGIRFTIKFY